MSDRIPTLAEICSAIAEGRLSANSDGSTYQISALALRRYFSSQWSSLDFADPDIIPLLSAEQVDLPSSNHFKGH